jgi:hypothetical protein
LLSPLIQYSAEIGVDKLPEMRLARRLFPMCATRLALAAIVLAGFSTLPAAGSQLWNWNYSASGITASGTFTTLDSPEASGGYLITNITGSRNGEAITGLQAPGTAIPGNEPFTVDDLVFPGPGPQLSGDGFGFATADGNFSNPFYADFLSTPGYLEFFSTPPFTGEPSDSTELPVQFSAAPVFTPEPATGILTFAGLAFVCRYRWRCC